MRLVTHAPWPRRRRHPRPPQVARHRRAGDSWPRNETTFLDACRALWAVRVMGWTQTAAAHVLRLNQGTVSRIVRGLQFPDAYPVPIPGFGGGGCVPPRQGELSL